jgi:hypothetical protein
MAENIHLLIIATLALFSVFVISLAYAQMATRSIVAPGAASPRD